MRALGDQDHPARIAARLERGADREQPAQFAVGARLGAHRDSRHAGQRLEPLADEMDQRECALRGLHRRERMEISEAGQPRHLLVEPRIVLHRAAAEREDAEVDRVVLTRQTRIMAHRLRLAEARQTDRAAPFQSTQPMNRRRDRLQVDPRRAHAADLEDQRLLEHQRLVAGEGRHFGRVARFGTARPSVVVHAHASVSSSAPASAATSSSVTVSVTATTNPLASASTPG